MLKKHPLLARNILERHLIQFSKFLDFFAIYIKGRVRAFSLVFEKNKNLLVKVFIMKRGRYNRPFLHLATLGVLGFGILFSPILASTYPVFSQSSSVPSTIDPAVSNQSITVGQDVFGTQVSQKPRDKIINYTVQRGDTLSTIAQKFGISTDTIKWENNLTSDSLTVGDDLRILPWTGISYKVQKGDTIYTIAKKLSTEPQKIADWPFNDFANPETFSLVEGQMLMVPDGVKPSERPAAPIRPRVYIAQTPGSVSSGGFSWPVRGSISQFASWYHMALDITDPIGTPVVAANSGVVSSVSVGSYDGGYGTNVYISGNNGYQTHYAHMSGVNVAVGQRVTAGSSVIGWVGLTGRTTGAHLHFEIIQNGALLNPLSFLQ